MKKFKSPTSRLVRLFKKGRDDWKAKALEKQRKIRALEIKIRDLSESRERWKQQAKFALKKLTAPGIKTVPPQKTESKEETETRVGWSEPANSNIYGSVNILLDFLRQSNLPTYQDLVPALQILLAQQQGNLKQFYQQVAHLGQLPLEQRHAYLRQLMTH